jgi:hypothetical protein
MIRSIFRRNTCVLPRTSRLRPAITIISLAWSSVALLGPVQALRAQNSQIPRQPEITNVEELLIARSVRESRIKPTEFCTAARIGFPNSIYEDRYTFRSIAIQPSDGRIVDTNAKTLGTGHACFGSTDDPKQLSFYAEITLGSSTFKGIGSCRFIRRDFPERGLTPNNCFLDISGIPRPYIGGLLTTNTMVSLNQFGLESKPPGYTQSSIATIRLWKQRSAP